MELKSVLSTYDDVCMHCFESDVVTRDTHLFSTAGAVVVAASDIEAVGGRS